MIERIRDAVPVNPADHPAPPDPWVDAPQHDVPSSHMDWLGDDSQDQDAMMIIDQLLADFPRTPIPEASEPPACSSEPCVNAGASAESPTRRRVVFVLPAPDTAPITYTIMGTQAYVETRVAAWSEEHPEAILVSDAITPIDMAHDAIEAFKRPARTPGTPAGRAACPMQAVLASEQRDRTPIYDDPVHDALTESFSGEPSAPPDRKALPLENPSWASAHEQAQAMLAWIISGTDRELASYCLDAVRRHALGDRLANIILAFDQPPAEMIIGSVTRALTEKYCPLTLEL